MLVRGSGEETKREFRDRVESEESGEEGKRGRCREEMERSTEQEGRLG